MADTVLVIDDSQRIVDIVKYFLEREGYVVKTALNPKDGIRVAQQGGVDLIMLDIMMPEMDGYAVGNALRKDAKTRDIPIVMLTAESIIAHTPKGFFYGLYGYLSKPFSKDQLLTIVADTLQLTRKDEGKIPPQTP